MNVLILTPDAVGSTLLQRLITIYMQFHEFDRPVINLHELTNGIETYYSPEFQREIVSKRPVKAWGYYQTLEEIVAILGRVDHYKTSRLAHYHLKNRQDPVAQQIPFYRYLDDNFFVIACRRRNIFEHAISMIISKITKRLNVFDHREKIDTFSHIYRNKVEIDTQVFAQQLDAYRDYLAWSEQYFNISSFFVYEEHLPEIEKFILNLPIFSTKSQTITWKEKFGMEFNDWNRCHHMASDIGYIALTQAQALTELTDPTADAAQLMLEYQAIALPEWPAVHTVDDYQQLPIKIKNDFLQKRMPPLQALMSPSRQQLYQQHQAQFRAANQTIDRMRELDIIVTPPPIKKQSLAEKLFVTKNWAQCLEIYNAWLETNPGIGETLDAHTLREQIQQEQQFWYGDVNGSWVQDDPLAVEQLVYQNDARL